MFKTDLHTHSEASPDGGITLAQYQKVLNDGVLDCIAITDHNEVDFALHAHKTLGNKIIVGEEIMTTKGEIIGLFLKEKVAPQQSPADTVVSIKSQGGLVYIPHPFETVRKGMHPTSLWSVIAMQSSTPSFRTFWYWASVMPPSGEASEWVCKSALNT